MTCDEGVCPIDDPFGMMDIYAEMRARQRKRLLAEGFAFDAQLAALRDPRAFDPRMCLGLFSLLDPARSSNRVEFTPAFRALRATLERSLEAATSFTRPSSPPTRPR